MFDVSRNVRYVCFFFKFGIRYVTVPIQSLKFNTRVTESELTMRAVELTFA